MIIIFQLLLFSYIICVALQRRSWRGTAITPPVWPNPGTPPDVPSTTWWTPVTATRRGATHRKRSGPLPVFSFSRQSLPKFSYSGFEYRSELPSTKLFSTLILCIPFTALLFVLFFCESFFQPIQPISTQRCIYRKFHSNFDINVRENKKRFEYI